NIKHVLCPLCVNKTFKNSHGLHIHQSAIHNTKKHLLNKENEHLTCILCPKKIYKSIQGLHQHETLRHPHYNIPSPNLIDLPQQHINEIKETL
ncbi:2031_t:CDS:1, partial [Racocetra fulgida]